jgi:hypothetical protein
MGLRWDNLKDGREWLAGPAPRFSTARRWHEIALDPGESAFFIVAQSAGIRLIEAGSMTEANAWEAWVSTAGGLWRQVAWIPCDDAAGLFAPLPDHSLFLVRLARSAGSSSRGAAALFNARRDVPPDLAPYRHGMPFAGESHRIQREGEPNGREFWPMHGGQPVRFSQDGPTVLRGSVHAVWPDLTADTDRFFRMFIRIGDGCVQAVELPLELEQRHRLRLDGQLRFMSSPAEFYLAVPSGRHQIELEAVSDVLIAMDRQELPDYLVPGLNEPKVGAERLLRQWNAAVADVPIAHSLTNLFAGWPALAPLGFWEQWAWSLARDNQVRDSGAQAADIMQRLSRQRPDYPKIRSTANKLSGLHTFYRELLPANKSGEDSVVSGWIVSPQLRDQNQPDRPWLFSEASAAKAIRRIPSQLFVPIPLSPAAGLIYHVPPRAHESELRLGVLGGFSTNTTRIQVQYDNQEPLQLEFRIPLHTRILEMQPAYEQVLSAMTAFPANSRHLCSNTVELSLPASVRTIRVWGEKAGEHSIKVAVAYRTARPFSLDETEHLALLDRLGSAMVLSNLVDELALTASSLPVSEIAATSPLTTARLASTAEAIEAILKLDLQNQWIPLKRLVLSRAREFVKGLDKPKRGSDSVSEISDQEIEALYRLAHEREANNRWLDALGVWSRLSQDPRSYAEGWSGVGRCLPHLGEPYLAEQYLRVLMVYGLDATNRQQGFNALQAIYLATENDEAMDTLQTVRALACPCPVHISDWLPALARSGQPEIALQIGLALPCENRPAGLLLRLAWQQSWWQAYQRLVEDLPDMEQRNFWLGWKAVAHGHYDEAKSSWKQAGKQGDAYWNALEQGLAIRSRLMAANGAGRLQTIRAWEEWWSNHPGARVWESRPELVRSFAGTALVYSRQRDLYASYFVAQPDRPVVMRMNGPGRIRLDTRLVLPRSSTEPVNDWLWIREGQHTNRFPLTQILPSENLTLSDEQGEVAPGTSSSMVLSLGAGCHELSVAAASHAVLIQVQLEQPEMRMEILPWIELERIQTLCESHSRTATILETNVAKDSATSVEAVRVALRYTCDPWLPGEIDVRWLESLLVELSPEERWLVVLRTGQWSWIFNHQDLFSSDAIISAWKVTGQIDRWLQALASEQPGEITDRLAALLEIADLYPEWRERAQIAGEMLVSNNALSTECQGLLARLVTDRDWVLLPVTPRSAGVRWIETPVDTPETMNLRVRQVLLPPASPSCVTLSGASVLSMALRLTQPTRIVTKIWLDRAGFQPLTPMKAVVQVDDLPPVWLPLGPENRWQQSDFAIPAGEHRLRLWIDDPVINQMVRVELSESPKFPGDPRNAPMSERLIREQRLYHRATVSEPVRFAISGPKLIRIEEWKPAAPIIRYREIAAGSQTVNLLPSDGDTEGFFRIFCRVTRPESLRSRRPVQHPGWMPIVAPRFILPERTKPTALAITDHYRMGRQEDGTWTLGLQGVQRFPFDLADTRDRVKNRFLELDAVYRYQNRNETLWMRTDALARQHHQGDGTYGLRQAIMGDPVDSTINWRWEGEAYLGNLTDPLPSMSDSWETGLHTAAFINQRRPFNERAQHTPFAGAFGHYSTLDSLEATRFDYLDQDVFSQYRGEHRWGWTIGDAVEYRPWLDTEWQATISLASNEDLNPFAPDHWGIQLAWRQLLGPARVNAGYQLKHFLADDDRDSDLFRQALSLEVLWEHWIRGRHRLEAGGLLRHHWPEREFSCYLVLNWHFSAGRFLRDFHPRETDFRRLRHQRIPAESNNSSSPGLDLFQN